MTEASLTDIGLIFMVNIMLISNYFFVRALRKTVDHALETGSDHPIQNRRRSNLLIALRERFPSSRFIGGRNLNQRDDSSTSEFQGSSHSADANESEKQCTLRCFQNSAFAFVCGRQILPPSMEKRFPGWRPIPYKLGIISTCFALMVTILLLSTEIVEDRINVNLIRSKGNSTGLCNAEEYNNKTEIFRERMLDLTNYEKSELQKDKIADFTEALLSDTTDYGTDRDLGCQGKKVEYEEENKHLLQGPFFPAYCPEARKLSLSAAGKTCNRTERVCINALSCNATEEVPIVCPPHSNDADVVDTDNYRLKQLKNLAQQELQEDTDKFDKDDLRRRSAEFVDDMLKQINTAGTLYSIYVCLGLFFPSPLRLFRPSMAVRAKQIVFGVDKMSFIVIVLLIWWLLKYIEIITSSFDDHRREISSYIQNFVYDPCFLNVSFVTERYKIWNDVCSDLSNYENEWVLAKDQVNQIKLEVEAFDNDNSCTCIFSGTELNKFSSTNTTLLSELGFGDTRWNIMKDGGFWTPIDDSIFLGNSNICDDVQYAKDHIFTSENMELNFWESWIKTGLLANLLVKIAITNFCVSLLNLADPFVTCGGTYESPPPMFNQDNDDTTAGGSLFTVGEDVKNDKAASLKAIAVRQSLFWGVITNACLICLLSVAVTNVGDFHLLDLIVFGSLILISFSVPCCCFYLTYCMSAALPEDSSYEGFDMDDHSGLFPISTPTRPGKKVSTPKTKPTPETDGSRTPNNFSPKRSPRFDFERQTERERKNSNEAASDVKEGRKSSRLRATHRKEWDEIRMPRRNDEGVQSPPRIQRQSPHSPISNALLSSDSLQKFNKSLNKRLKQGHEGRTTSFNHEEDDIESVRKDAHDNTRTSQSTNRWGDTSFQNINNFKAATKTHSQMINSAIVEEDTGWVNFHDFGR